MLHRLVGLVEVVLEEDNTLFIVLKWRNAKVINNQRSSGRDSLEADVRVVEVGSCILKFGVNLVVKASFGCNGPLTDWRAITERCCALGEAMPMLICVRRSHLRHQRLKLVIPWLC